jgi:hypothetical protein
VRAKDGKHAPLIVEIEMKEAVPRHHAVEGPSERQRAHVGDNPFAVREVAARKRDHRRRRIDATNVEASRQ